ncbi:MAG: sensor histidine kinase KdpD [Fibrobacter sp.]|nr:sensor histidine kinase KdpD [Fibrobacter sp.]
MDTHLRNAGKLKIFFGMAPGVGKTLTMLKAGLDIQARGANVVVGYVETHGDPEESEIISKIEMIPLVLKDDDFPYGEMNLDAVLARRPQIVLIDRMEHINHPKARHRFRWQDIQELLDHGISVYTTLNVHHVESLIDIVFQITGIRCTEIVPDRMLDSADEIELVDMPQDELLVKFTDNKINVPDYMKTIAHDFYRKGNLTALREIALRTLAKRVNLQLTEYMHQRNIHGPWKTNERFMVAIDASVRSEELIRMTTRMSLSVEGMWYAVHVQTNDTINAVDEPQLKRNFMLVRELGGELIATADTDIASGILRTAKQKNVSQIIVGKSYRHPLLRLIGQQSIVDNLIKNSGGIDIHVIECCRNDSKVDKPKTATESSVKISKQYLLTLGITALVSILGIFLQSLVNYHLIAIAFLFTNTFMALFFKRGPVIAASVVSAIVWGYMFVPPPMQFSPKNINDIVLMGMYVLLSTITSSLAIRVRNKDELVHFREHQTSTLLSFVESLSTVQSIDDIFQISEDHISRTFGAKSCFYYPDQSENLDRQIHSASTFTDPVYDTALWVFMNKKPAGKGTDTFQRVKGTYYPLINSGKVEGVIGIHFESQNSLSLNNEALLLTFFYHISLALDKERLNRHVGESRIYAESERLYKTLFNSISHELRTPLSTIHGASAGLLDEKTSDDPRIRKTLAKDIHDATGRLNRLVENLLNMSRLESGRIRISRQWCDIQDLYATVKSQFAAVLSKHEITIDVEPDFPFIKIDDGLFYQIVSNIVLNSAQYCPQGTKISMKAFMDNSIPTLRFDDTGNGFPANSIPRLFDKFYRVPGTTSGGTGLGLSIAKGFVDAHGATITAANNEHGGAQITITLPSMAQPVSMQDNENG